MNREFIEDAAGNVSCIVAAEPPKKQVRPFWLEFAPRKSADVRNWSADYKMDRDAVGYLCRTFGWKYFINQSYYWCGFCQSTFDIDYPQIDVSPNDTKARCPNDHNRLERLTASIEVG